ncbi:MAG: FAD-dependent oxidoreductase, partial [Oscillospiraceae bacterium]|nr:FAD-dependent oxidoreductase [Oscillospiraceae bacterium]
EVTANVPTEEVKNIIKAFTDAADLGVQCGFDVIMIHGGHGNVPSMFFSPLFNKRTDCYGGSFENRCRFGIELLDSIRARIGNSAAIEYRISAEEMLEGYTTFEETLEYAKVIKDKIDLLHVSRGLLEVSELLPIINTPPYLERGLNLPFAKRFKEELDIPVTVVGGFDLELAEKAVSSGDVDMVSMIRTIYADTNCVNKARLGRYEDIRPCVRCNTCIGRTHTERVDVRCAVNPVLGRQTHFDMRAKAPESLNVAVVGGGPAGLEAARTAAMRGHKVTLFEKEDTLGGMLRCASAAEFKYDMRRYLDWSCRSVMNNENITVKLGTQADAAALEGFDAVIAALGAKPIIPSFPSKGKTLWAGDVDMGKCECGRKVVIAGAGFTGLECALALLKKGHEVLIIDMMGKEHLGEGGVEISNIGLLQELDKAGAAYKFNVKLVDVTQSGAVIQNEDGSEELLECDSVVLSLGLRPDKAAMDKIAAARPDAIFVGDCAERAGTLKKAVHGAFSAAYEL